MKHQLLAIAAVLALAAPAAAQPAGPRKPPTAADKKLAETKLRQAAQQYQAGDRLGAVKTFEEAYAIFPSPVILFNLGKAYHGVGRNAVAHRSLSRYLREDKAVKPDRKAETERMLREVEKVVGLIDVQVSAAGVVITVNGDEVGVAPLSGPVAVEPGVHMVVALDKGKELASRQVTVGTGKRVVAQLAFISSPADDDVVRPRGHGGGPVVPPPHAAAGDPADDDDDVGGAGALGVERRRDDGGGAPIYKKWWFWTGIGVAVIAASAFAITRDRGTVNDLDPSLGMHDFGSF